MSCCLHTALRIRPGWFGVPLGYPSGAAVGRPVPRDIQQGPAHSPRAPADFAGGKGEKRGGLFCVQTPIRAGSKEKGLMYRQARRSVAGVPAPSSWQGGGPCTHWAPGLISARSFSHQRLAVQEGTPGCPGHDSTEGTMPHALSPFSEFLPEHGFRPVPQLCPHGGGAQGVQLRL